MKANEFVKKFGWERSRAASKMHIADFCRCFDLPMSFLIDMRDDLKHLVESHELVGKVGGIEKAKLRCYPAKHLTMDSYHRLKQAIADVESCQ